MKCAGDVHSSCDVNPKRLSGLDIFKWLGVLPKLPSGGTLGYIWAKKVCGTCLYINLQKRYLGVYLAIFREKWRTVGVPPVCSWTLPPRYYSKRGGLSPVYTFIKQLTKMVSWCLFGYIAWFRVSCETYGVRPPT